MLKIQIWSHKDGDRLAVVEVPWWHDVAEWGISKVFCSCCGFSGFLSRRSETIEVFFFRTWNKLLDRYVWKKERLLYETPIEASCLARSAIYEGESACWRDDCPHCWHLQDDAFISEATDEAAVKARKR